MIKINYQSFGKGKFQLRLRLYDGGETKYINVTKLLKGSIQKRHWNQKKQLFTASCPFSEENNDIIVKFRQKYQEAAIDWTGSVFGLVLDMDNKPKESPEAITVSEFIQLVVERLNRKQHKDGTKKGTYENYLKCDKRMSEYCKAHHIQYEKLRMVDITPAFINGIFDWVDNTRKGKGMCYISKILHSLITKAEGEGLLKVEDFKRCRWFERPVESSQKCNTLTEAQIKKFKELNLRDISKSQFNELYRDFCIFLLYTGVSVCDAAVMKYSDIKTIEGISHFVFKRRKIVEKQAVPCAVPINQELHDIMRRWKHLAKDGYIFPIRNKHKLATQTTNNGDIKHFLYNLNCWLKKIGKELKCSFPLHTYTFRHTAITRYLSKGVPVVYVANMMGTSVENCEKIYYNNQADISSRNKVLSAMTI